MWELLHFCKESFRLTVHKNPLMMHYFIADTHACTRASTHRYTRVYSDGLTRAEDTVDSGVIKELIVLRGNNTTTHDDYITVNKTNTKALNTQLAAITFFWILIAPFYTTWRGDYQVTRTMCCNLQYDGNLLKNPFLIEVEKKSPCFHLDFQLLCFCCFSFRLHKLLICLVPHVER